MKTGPGWTNSIRHSFIYIPNKVTARSSSQPRRGPAPRHRQTLLRAGLTLPASAFLALAAIRPLPEHESLRSAIQVTDDLRLGFPPQLCCASMAECCAPDPGESRRSLSNLSDNGPVIVTCDRDIDGASSRRGRHRPSRAGARLPNAGAIVNPKMLPGRSSAGKTSPAWRSL
jgi:hypothetical protein